MVAEKTKITVKGRQYVVSHDGREVLYVLANSAVMGWKPIHLTGRLGRAAVEKFHETYDRGPIEIPALAHWPKPKRSKR